MNNIAILLVEDDEILRKSLARALAKYARVYTCADEVQALTALGNCHIDLALIDLNLGKNDLDGISVIRQCHEQKIETIVLTNQDKKEVIAQAFAAGCSHYFSKYDFEENIEQRIGGILKNLRGNNDSDFFSRQFVTKNQNLINKILMLKNGLLGQEQKVIFTGPTGVGKSLVAKLLHQSISPDAPFVHVNLSELPENLIESELFGHSKGAFTGALNEKEGLLAKANGGTLFLDEIGTIPLNIQTKLLRVLEDRTFCKVGDTQLISANFRLMCATCDDLSQLILENKFRVDFYFRIKGIEIDIPGLKFRTGDIIPLIDHFIKLAPKKVALTKEAEEVLVNYDWFGNIREMKDLINQFLLMPKGIIDASDLPHYIRQNVNPFNIKATKNQESGLVTQEMIDFVNVHGLNALTHEIQKRFIQRTIEESHGKINEVSRRLGISKTLLYKHHEVSHARQ